MSVTFLSAPGQRRKSTATYETRMFSQGCIRLGIARHKCGLRARDVLKEMLAGPLQERRTELGMLIYPHKLAVKTAAGYEITQAGRDWLKQLRAHKLLGELPKGVTL